MVEYNKHWKSFEMISILPTNLLNFWFETWLFIFAWSKSCVGIFRQLFDKIFRISHLIPHLLILIVCARFDAGKSYDQKIAQKWISRRLDFTKAETPTRFIIPKFNPSIRFYLEQFVLCSLVQHNKYNVLICLFVSVHNCKFLCSIESCNFRLSVFYRNHQC